MPVPNVLERIEWDPQTPPIDAWPVHERYELQQLPDGILVISAQGGLIRRYNLTEQDLLLNRFMNTRGNHAAILEFVREFGYGGFIRWPRQVHPAHAKPQDIAGGERISDWEQAYYMLRSVQGCVFMRREHRLPHPDDRQLVSRPRRSGKATIQDVIVEEAHRLPRASMFFSRWLYRQPGLDSRGRPDVEDVPRGLLGVLWKQMLKYYMGTLDWRTCRGCPETMLVGAYTGKAKRQDSEFHSTPCRVKYINRWRSDALHRHRAGESTQSIAEAWGLEPARVAKWLLTADRQRKQPGSSKRVGGKKGRR